MVCTHKKDCKCKNLPNWSLFLSSIGDRYIFSWLMIIKDALYNLPISKDDHILMKKAFFIYNVVCK